MVFVGVVSISIVIVVVVAVVVVIVVVVIAIIFAVVVAIIAFIASWPPCLSSSCHVLTCRAQYHLRSLEACVILLFRGSKQGPPRTGSAHRMRASASGN